MKDKIAKIQKDIEKREKKNSSEAVALKQDIFNLTKDGRVQDWNERIADIAKLANLELGNIVWASTPNEAIRTTLNAAIDEDKFDFLKNIIEKLKNK